MTVRCLERASVHRSLLALLFAGGGFVGAAQAQIGQSPAQCQARYGKPMRQQDGTSFYEKDGLAVAATFAGGKADSIRFHHLKEDAAHVPVELTKCGLLMLLKTRRPSAARVAFFLGLTTVLLAGGLCGLIYWGDAISDWYKVPVGTLLVGWFVCALAWRPAFRRRGGVQSLSAAG